MNDVAVRILVFADGIQRDEGQLLRKDELARPLPEFQRQKDRRVTLGLINELAAAAQDEIQAIGNLLGKGEAGRGGGQGGRELLVICYRLSSLRKLAYLSAQR